LSCWYHGWLYKKRLEELLEYFFFANDCAKFSLIDRGKKIRGAFHREV